MILFEITNTEQNPVYQALAVANGSRQFDFLRSIVDASISVQRAFLSTAVIKALNFQAITCLHTNAGEFRPCPVRVGDDFIPPEHFRVQALMDDFINIVNRSWETADPVFLAAFVLWRLNFIHPFINGNGRTARAASYFVLCVKSGGWLAGAPILPELLVRDRPQYVTALKEVDQSFLAGNLNLQPLHDIFTRLLQEQVDSVQPAQDENPAVA